jgi:ankyrin repeat protein
MIVNLLGHAVPYEIAENILLRLDANTIRNIGKDNIPDDIWWKKYHATIKEAADAGNLIGVKYLATKHNAYDALLISIKHKHMDIIEYLIEQYDNVRVNDNKIIHYIAKHGQLEIVKYFVKKQKLTQNSLGIVLCLSAEYSHLNTVKYLAEECGINVHEHNELALRDSTRNGHFEVVKYLIDIHRVDIHAYYNETLQYAIQNGHLEILKYLIAYCTCTNRPWKRYLISSCRNGHLELVKCLFEYCDDYYGDALVCSAEYGKLDIVKYIIDCKITCANKDAALLEAATEGHLDVVKFLCECGANSSTLNIDALRKSAQNYGVGVQAIVNCDASAWIANGRNRCLAVVNYLSNL